MKEPIKYSVVLKKRLMVELCSSAMYRARKPSVTSSRVISVSCSRMWVRTWTSALSAALICGSFVPYMACASVTPDSILL